MSAVDFIELFPQAVPRAECEALVARMRASQALQPGRIGGGVFPELKHSRDLHISTLPDWRDAETALNLAVFRGLLAYIRKYPQTLIAPLMLQHQDGSGKARRLDAADVSAMTDGELVGLATHCVRPGSINLQWYRADEGGYPYWHCELYPKEANAETLHRHLLWTIYLNEDFGEGETEFHFQQRKIKPAVGDLLIAPTAFTHTHRGNRPRGGDKFIATSWILFQRAEQLFPAG